MADAASITARLATVCVGIRRDLHVSRHVFRREVAYVIQDPVTFQHFRLSPQNYTVLMAIREDRPLGDIFADLVAQDRLTPSDESDFYRFILMLHRLNFLHLPLADEQALYERHVARRKARIQQTITGFLFLQVPVWNPDAFLERTVRFVRPLFSRTCLILWTLLMGAMAVGIFQNRHEILQPINGLLSPGNLAWMWVALFGLKLVHEFGHAYACKNFGGHVPEMGLYFIVFAPCTYVDASASWGFERKWDRLWVSLGGMYFESFCAAAALFIWLGTEPGFLNSMAYKTFFMAGVVTLLFNINPLMRYDGYYVLSDLVEIPNLRQRSSEYLRRMAKTWFLGLPGGGPSQKTREKWLLGGFGLATTLYRTMVITGICMVVAYRFFAFGILLALFCVFLMIARPIARLLSYLWFAKETAGVRGRAVGLTALVLVGVPAALGLIPVRLDICAPGVVKAAATQVVRAPEDGVVMNMPSRAGDQVDAGVLLVQLQNPIETADFKTVRAALQGARIRQSAYETFAPAEARREAESVSTLKDQLAVRQAKLDSFTVRAELDGRILAPEDKRLLGAYVRKGTPLITLASRCQQVRVLVTADELTRSRPTVGQPVEFRSQVCPEICFPGRIDLIEPAGSRALDLAQLTSIGGGDLVVGPSPDAPHQPMAAKEPYFNIVVSLDTAGRTPLPFDSRGKVRLRSEAAPIGLALYRGTIRFIRSFAQS